MRSATTAAEALRPRQATDYVPMLMAAMRAPIEVDVELQVQGRGDGRLSEIGTRGATWYPQRSNGSETVTRGVRAPGYTLFSRVNPGVRWLW